jgi:hypothetical protein
MNHIPIGAHLILHPSNGDRKVGHLHINPDPWPVKENSVQGYLMGFLLASKVVASTLPEAQPKTRNIFLHSKIPAK